MKRGQLFTWVCLMLLFSGMAAKFGAAANKQLISHNSTNPALQYVTVAEDAGLDLNPVRAQEVAQYIASSGFNSWRVDVPWTHGQAEIKNDSLRICNVGQAALKYHLALFLTIVAGNSTGRPVNPPVRPGEMQRYATTASAYVATLIGPSGCAQGLQLFIEPINEPNYRLFWPSQHNVAKNYVRLQAIVYSTVKRDAAAMGVNVTIIGGALTARHDTAGFIESMGQAMHDQHTGRIFDWFSYHCYGTGTSQVMTEPDSIQTALQRATGSIPPMVCSEYGVKTTIPRQQSSHYRDLSAASSGVRVSERVQAQLYTQALRRASCDGLRGITVFHLFDDPSLKDWQSGLFYFDPTLGQSGDQPIAKSSLPFFQPVAQAVIYGCQKTE